MPKYRVTLSDGRRVTVEAAQPPSEADVLSALGSSAPPQQPSPTAPEQERGFIDRAVDALPMVGGIVGGFAGGAPTAILQRITGVNLPNPLGMAGAALGGAAGEGIKQTVNALRGDFADVPETVGGRLRRIGGQAVAQGGMEGVGRGVGAGLKRLAPKIASVALAPVKTLGQKHPRIAETYVREGKLFSGLRGGVGAIGKPASAQQAGTLRAASRATSDQLVSAADAAGAPPIPGRKIIRGLTPLADRASRLAETGAGDTSQSIIKRGQRFLAKNEEIPLTKAHEMRRLLDEAADPVFKQAQRGAVPKAAVRNAEVDQALANRLRRELRSNVKGLEASDARTMDLAGLEKALKDASFRKHLLTRNLGLTSGAIGVGTGLMSGDPAAGASAGLGTLATYYALTNPRNLGRMALASQGAGRAAEMSPQAARAALIALMQQSQGSEEEP